MKVCEGEICPRAASAPCFIVICCQPLLLAFAAPMIGFFVAAWALPTMRVPIHLAASGILWCLLVAAHAGTQEGPSHASYGSSFHYLPRGPPIHHVESSSGLSRPENPSVRKDSRLCANLQQVANEQIPAMAPHGQMGAAWLRRVALPGALARPQRALFDLQYRRQLTRRLRLRARGQRLQSAPRGREDLRLQGLDSKLARPTVVVRRPARSQGMEHTSQASN